MSTIEEVVTKDASVASARTKPAESVLARLLKLLCSVRFGVTLLVLLGLACLIGMLIMQQNVDGFDRYFAELTPAQQIVYSKLGFFDIYHVWYFNVLLAILSLNIVLASIDRFPKTWLFVSKPNVSVPIRWLREQKQTAEINIPGAAEDVIVLISAAMKGQGWRNIKTTVKAGRIFILGQEGVWNRLGAYAVHVGLLTIFTGGFLTAQFGSTGQMPLAPGTSTNLIFETEVNLDKAVRVTKRLPFEIVCTDMQQKLIKKEGPITAPNTIDWITRFTITDETGTHEAHVQMNHPFDYRGYRFFQASFIPTGRARNVTINAKPATGGDVEQITIARDGSAVMKDGTTLKLNEFRGNFSIGKEEPNENTSDYPNPAAVLEVTPPGSPGQTAYAFGPKLADIPIAKKPVGGYTYQLADFEKVADQHILSVQRDPGSAVVYVGFILLFLTLVAVFFFSHQRVWAAVDGGEGTIANVVFGGNANRNVNAFDEKFRKFIANLAEPSTDRPNAE
jgi:cytochrome c biogenesis protein